jgi:hypothetical protein
MPPKRKKKIRKKNENEKKPAITLTKIIAAANAHSLKVKPLNSSSSPSNVCKRVNAALDLFEVYCGHFSLAFEHAMLHTIRGRAIYDKCISSEKCFFLRSLLNFECLGTEIETLKLCSSLFNDVGTRRQCEILSKLKNVYGDYKILREAGWIISVRVGRLKYLSSPKKNERDEPKITAWEQKKIKLMEAFDLFMSTNAQISSKTGIRRFVFFFFL